MRILLDITVPLEPFNTYVRDGTAGQKLGRIIDELKPEAMMLRVSSLKNLAGAAHRSRLV
jgi:hypothetical protein